MAGGLPTQHIFRLPPLLRLPPACRASPDLQVIILAAVMRLQAEGGEVEADLVVGWHCDGPGAVAVVRVVAGVVRGCQHARLRHQSATACCTHRPTQP